MSLIASTIHSLGIDKNEESSYSYSSSGSFSEQNSFSSESLESSIISGKSINTKNTQLSFSTEISPESTIIVNDKIDSSETSIESNLYENEKTTTNISSDNLFSSGIISTENELGLTTLGSNSNKYDNKPDVIPQETTDITTNSDEISERNRHLFSSVLC